MKRYIKLFESDIYYINKYNETTLNRKARKGDILPIYNFNRKKPVDYIILEVIEFDSENKTFAGFKKGIQDYMIVLKPKSGRAVYKTFVNKDGSISDPELYRVSDIEVRDSKDAKFIRKYYNN